MDELLKKLTPSARQLFESSARQGDFGNTLEEVVLHILNHKAVFLDDLRLSAITGSLLLGKDDSWIVNNTWSGQDKRIRVELANVKKYWCSHSTEPLPQQKE